MCPNTRIIECESLFSDAEVMMSGDVDSAVEWLPHNEASFSCFMRKFNASKSFHCRHVDCYSWPNFGREMYRRRMLCVTFVLREVYFQESLLLEWGKKSTKDTTLQTWH